MKKVIILFENITQNLIIDPNKKYCLYYKGCFCPPHIGHFDIIRKYVEHNSNVKIIVNQQASYSRHRVPRDVSIHIMKTYIKELLPINRVSLVFKESKYNLLNHKFVKEADVFVSLRGNEKKRKYEQNFLQPITNNNGTVVENRTIINKVAVKKDVINIISNKYFNKELLQQHKNVIYYYTDRGENGPSATKFTETIIKYKNNDATYDDVVKFLPEKLSDNIKKYIISRL
jgi:phosphopantetheine adenylyltransferase